MSKLDTPELVREVEFFEEAYARVCKKEKNKFNKDFYASSVKPVLRQLSTLPRFIIQHPVIFLLMTTFMVILIFSLVVYVVKGVGVSEVAAKLTLNIAFTCLTSIWTIMLIIQTYLTSKIKTSPTAARKFHWIADELIKEYREKNYSIDSLEYGIDRSIKDKNFYCISFAGLWIYLFTYLKIGELLFEDQREPLIWIIDIYFQGPLQEYKRIFYSILFLFLATSTLVRAFAPRIWLNEIKDFVVMIKEREPKA